MERGVVDRFGQVVLAQGVEVESKATISLQSTGTLQANSSTKTELAGGGATVELSGGEVKLN